MTNVTHPKCFICSGEFSYLLTHYDSLFNLSSKEFDIFRCKNCDLFKILPQPTPEEIQGFYPTDYYSHQSSDDDLETGNPFFRFYNILNDTILDLNFNKKSSAGRSMVFLARLLKNSISCLPLNKPKEGGRFLDIGSGSGYWVKKLVRYGWKCTGIDIAGQESENILIGDFLKTPFQNKFEFIRIHGVLEHVPQPDAFLTKAEKLLEDNGQIHISLPTTNCISYKIFKRHWIGLEVPRHLHSFNEKNLAQLLKKGLPQS